MPAQNIPAPLKGHNITQAQACFMAQALRQVAHACDAFEVDEFTSEEFMVLSDQLGLEPVRGAPRAVIPRMSFGQLRHCVPTLQRTEKNNSQGSTDLWLAAQSGALDLMAEDWRAVGFANWPSLPSEGTSS